MAISNFIPAIWSASILRALEQTQTWTQAGVVNRDYEGEIQNAGDRVKINSISDPTISDYTGTLPDPEELTDSQKELVIDQQKTFNFVVDDIDAAQANVTLMDEAGRRAGIRLNDTAASFISNLSLGADTQNVLGSAAAPLGNVDKTTVYEFLTELGKRLDDADVPKEGRWVQAPSWLEALIKNADLVTKADLQMIKNGVVGRVAGFDIISASVVPVATDATAGDSDVVVAGHSLALSYAEQIIKTEAYRPEKKFGDALKGLHVYGGKLVRPEALSIAYCTKTAGTFGDA